MAIILALPRLYDAVVARFAAEAAVGVDPVPNLFGWRTSAQKLITGNRICWIPGDPNGELGQVKAARNPGRNPRSLATIDELFTVEVIASDADPTKRENERIQYQAARVLYDAWYRAIHLAASGTFTIQSLDWITDKKERRFGAGIRAVCTIEAMLPDKVFTSAPVDTSAVIDTELLDVTEQDEITP